MSVADRRQTGAGEADLPSVTAKYNPDLSKQLCRIARDDDERPFLLAETKFARRRAVAIAEQLESAHEEIERLMAHASNLQRDAGMLEHSVELLTAERDELLRTGREP